MEEPRDLRASSGLASQRGSVVVSPLESSKPTELEMCAGGAGCGAGRQHFVTEVNAKQPVFLCPRGSRANARQLPSHLPAGCCRRSWGEDVKYARGDRDLAGGGSSPLTL